MSSAWRKWRKALAVGLALACGAAETATAQFFFRPFAYSYRYDLPPDDDNAPRYASRRAVARILAQQGYELAGPLGRRGDQIVAVGVSRRGGEVRFFIDPFEGEIIHALRLEAPPAEERKRLPDDDRSASPTSGPLPASKGAEGSRRIARQTPEIAPRPNPRSRPGETASSKATPTARSAQSPAPVSAPATTQKEPTPSFAAPSPTVARSTGSSHRAIVPPKPAEGAVAVTPAAAATATAPSPSGAKTPASIATPKAAQ